METRRYEGIALLKDGTSQSDVARRLSVSRQAIHKWWRTYRDNGWRSLKHRKAPGRPRKFATHQRKCLLELLKKGASHFGYSTDLWTLGRITDLVKRHFGIALHRSHVHRILVASGWSCQKPVSRAIERNEGRIRQWVRTTWPALKKKPGS